MAIEARTIMVALEAALTAEGWVLRCGEVGFHLVVLIFDIRILEKSEESHEGTRSNLILIFLGNPLFRILNLEQ